MEGFLRPEFEVLDERSAIPAENLVRPPPTQFTHRLGRAEPFFYGSAAPGTPSDGKFDARTDVVLLVHDGGERCRVVDGQGLYVEVSFASLSPLPASDPPPS